MKLEQVISESLQNIDFSLLSGPQNKNVIISEQKQKQQQFSNPKTSEYRRRMLDQIHLDERTSAEKKIEGNRNSNNVVPMTKPRNILEAVLKDTRESGFSVGEPEETIIGPGAEGPELVSEGQLQQLVGGRDYSKYL